jgi:hypothetical protein
LRLFGRCVVLSDGDGGLYSVLGDVEAFVIVFVRVFVIEGKLNVDALPLEFVVVPLVPLVPLVPVSDGNIIYYVNI